MAKRAAQSDPKRFADRLIEAMEEIAWRAERSHPIQPATEPETGGRLGGG